MTVRISVFYSSYWWEGRGRLKKFEGKQRSRKGGQTKRDRAVRSEITKKKKLIFKKEKIISDNKYI